LRPSQDPVIPLLVGGLIAVSIMATLSIVVWLWAMRRPTSAAPPPGGEVASTERPPLVYAAVGAQTGLGLDNDAENGRNWVEMLREMMPEGTRLLTFGRRGVTLAELNQVEIPAVAQAGPDIITLWNAVSDAVKSVPLPDYSKELQKALGTLLRGTQATILLLNLPDISLVTRDVTDEQRALVRGGVTQWNKAISDATARYGKRVRVVDVFPLSEQLLAGVQGDPADDSRQIVTSEERNGILAKAVWHTIEKNKLLEAR